MPQHTTQYHWLSCSAKIQNLQQPICPAVSDAFFGDAEEAISKITATGWTRNGREFLCPQHAKESVEAPARAPRKSKTPAAELPEQFG
jgi:hypothetical protein